MAYSKFLKRRAKWHKKGFIPLPSPVNLTLPTVSGTAQEGATLTFTPGTWDGSPTVTRWVQRNGVDVQTVTTTYVLQAADVGKVMRPRESAVNGSGTVEAFGMPTGTVLASGSGAPIMLTPPSIAGTAALGQPLTFTAGTYSGSGNTTVRHVQRDTTDISLDTDLGYTIQQPDVGHTIQLKEVTTNGSGSVTIFSTPTATVTSGATPGTYPTTGAVEPTGGQGGSAIFVNTLAALRAELQNPTIDPRQIYVGYNSSKVPTTNMVIETNSPTYMATIDGKQNFDLIGHKGVIFGKDSGLNILNAVNARFINMAIAPGADANGKDYSDRDCAVVRGGNDLAFINCSFFWAIDELLTYIRWIVEGTSTFNRPNPRRIRTRRCMLFQPLQQAGHVKGSHSFGLLGYSTPSPDLQEFQFDQNVFLNCAQRSPMIAYRGGRENEIINNLVVKYGGSGGGSGICINESQTEQNGQGGSCNIEGNLLHPPSQSVEHRARGITFSSVGTGNFIYIPATTDDYANHFFLPNGDTPDLDSDPYDRSQVYLHHSSAAGKTSSLVTSALVATKVPKLPTKTLANRQALYALLMGTNECVVGVRDFTGDPANGGTPVPGFNAMSVIGKAAMIAYRANGATFTAKGAFPNGPTQPRVEDNINIAYTLT